MSNYSVFLAVYPSGSIFVVLNIFAAKKVLFMMLNFRAKADALEREGVYIGDWGFRNVLRPSKTKRVNMESFL